MSGYFVRTWIASLLLVVSSWAQKPAFHTTTTWDLQPSFKYDALCLLNALSGDPYYLHYYQPEYDHFHPLFTEREQQAFVDLKAIFKDQGGGIISAALTLYFSATTAETLPEMIQVVQNSSSMESALRQTPYWNQEGWDRYEKARPALETALRALARVGLPVYWAKIAEPKVAERIQELKPELPRFNIVPHMEQVLGFPLSSDRITVYLLNYSEPHGIRITGLRFLTHVSYPFRIVLHNAIHEPMHPPYDVSDPAVKQAIQLLAEDPFIMEKVTHHNRSFGYNTATGYIEEDSVQALEQIVSEQVGVGRDVCSYWPQQDGGMHVLAEAIYIGYKNAITQQRQPYSRWFIHAANSGELRGKHLQDTVLSFASSCSQASQ